MNLYRMGLYGALGAMAAAAYATFAPNTTTATAAANITPAQPEPTSAVQPLFPAPVLGRTALEPASRDPFAAVAAPAPPAPPAPVPQTQKHPEPPPPAPPPPLDLRFAGRMTAPDGAQVVYALHGQATVVLVPGLELPNGYRVEKVATGTVEFVHPALNVTARLDIPPPPPFELR